MKLQMYVKCVIKIKKSANDGYQRGLDANK